MPCCTSRTELITRSLGVMSLKFLLATAIAVAMVCATGKHARAQEYASCVSSIRVSFNQYGNAQIAPGAAMWFSSVLEGVESDDHDLGTTPVRIDVRHARITFGNWPYTVAAPDSTIELDPSATGPERWWVGRSAWAVTFAPALLPDAFFDGLPFWVREPFVPGHSGPVTWTATFTASRPGITLRWAWSAAAYSQFGFNGALLVKPLGAPLGKPQSYRYQNDDPAGTPELYKQFVVAGAMGSGAPQFTGSLSKPATVRACVANEPPPRSSPALETAPAVRPASARLYYYNRSSTDPPFASAISQRVYFSDGNVGETVDKCDTGDLCTLVRYQNGDRLAVFSEGAAYCGPYTLYLSRTNGSRTIYAFSRDVDHDAQSGLFGPPCGRSRTTHITMDGGRIRLIISENTDGSLKVAFDIDGMRNQRSLVAPRP